MPNRLADETSPYLRQHAHNPVNWQPWGGDAFAEAAERDVPVLLSIGYSSCHWCHVMAHESFDDPAIAAVMNDRFVPVKVDREERPDIDAVYMEATQAMTGRGGWPMTVFLTHDRRPFYCGTYFPPTRRGGMPGFVDLMDAVHEAWTDRRDELESQADEITGALGSGPPRAEASIPAAAVLDAATEAMLARVDHVDGGFVGAPKFPSTLALEHLLAEHRRTGSTACLDAVCTALDAMASGGMVDLIGGGFCRYSVDERWLVPHFEKMLYDNALLTRLYTRAHAVTQEARYAQVIEETIAYVLADLSGPEGGRYSAEDADSLPAPEATPPDPTRPPATLPEEGAFYTFTPFEVDEALRAAGLGEQVESALSWWGITPEGNFEGRSIPNRLHARGDWLRPPAIEQARSALHAARATRPRPGLDDKVLTEWNAIWLAAVAEAGTTLQRPDWVAEAVRTAEFLCANLRDANGRWLRSWQAERGARQRAFGADHTALLGAFLALYRATGEQRWLAEAEGVAEELLERFWDPAGAIFTTDAGSDGLPVRPREVTDGATPSASSTAAVTLLQLEALTGEARWGEHARTILEALAPVAAKVPLAFGELLAAVHLDAVGITEVVVTGERDDLVSTVQQRFLPEVVLAWGEPGTGVLWEGRDERGAEGRAYVCRGYVCDAPVSDAVSLASALASASERGTSM
jgi:uncharacterized protein YyaL (SSP411 family)